jgi:two-component system chemotaxis response regulator CheB
LNSSKPKVQEDLYNPMTRCDKIISIAASTGGPPALTKVLAALPFNVPPILIVQHMPKGITKPFSERLNEICKFNVKEAEEGDMVRERLALIAPGGFHMVVTKEKRIHLTEDPPVNFVRPAADVLLYSLGQVYGPKNIAVVLTGMGADGAKGIRAIKNLGGITIAQDKDTSVVYGMPQMAFNTGCVDTVAPLDLIPKEIMKACN